MQAGFSEIAEINHQVSSEKYRLDTFSNLVNFPLETRYQLAVAGFIHRESQILCVYCGVTLNLQYLDENSIYERNYFRKLHRKKASSLDKHCPFLIYELGTNVDDLRSSVSRQTQKDKIEWNDAEQPDFSDYHKRLNSFHSWPYLKQQNTFVTPLKLAEYGFYYSGLNDGVTCFYCGNTIIDWSNAINSANKNIVQFEHIRFFPCHFITYVCGGKIVANVRFLSPVSLEERLSRNPIVYETKNISGKPQSIEECLLSFDNCPDELSTKAKTLAENGFYYVGYESTVKCYMCDLEIEQWHHGMTPLGVHIQNQKSCEIVQGILNTKKNFFPCNSEAWRLETFKESSLEIKLNTQLCQELAACGFYCHKKGDSILCAYCGVKIKPNENSSIMSQHRALSKQLRKISTVDCLIVRAQCSTNMVIESRKPFPEYPQYRSIFERINSFGSYSEKRETSETFIRDRVDAGFFFDGKRMRCFQCGNSLPVDNKSIYKKACQTDISKLHAYFYPTCEWVKQILGRKYVAQVLFDHKKANKLERQRSSVSQSSCNLSLVSLSSNSTTSDVYDFDSLIEPYESDESDYEDYETVASPFRSRCNNPFLPTSPLLSSESSSLVNGQICADSVSNEEQSQQMSMMLLKTTNPFATAFVSQVSSPSTDTSPPNMVSLTSEEWFAYEYNRLESFKKHDRTFFATHPIKELAYAGFYLNEEGTTIKCPWCAVAFTEKQYESILRRRPAIPNSPLIDELWTPMRVHRQAMIHSANAEHPWCLWVKRIKGGTHPNVPLSESLLKYPEYPSYTSIEKRIRSYETGWLFPSGSILSNVMMANAGFIRLNENKVCCHYCGNILYDFKPHDNPYEEHARHNPLCDYLIATCGADYIEKVLKEIPGTPCARQKSEIEGTKIIKRIIFDDISSCINKTKRSAVQIKMPNVITRTNLDNSENIDESCQICCSNSATYEYDPCRHYQMCFECSIKLTKEQHEQCMTCLRPATIKLRMSGS